MTNDLAPHVQDILRALGNKLDPDQVEDELRKYLDYGVPLAQAKRDIVHNHGGNRGGPRELAELAGNERGIDLVVLVQTVNEKEITTKDGTKTIWDGFLADATRSLRYTAWKDFRLEAGRSYEIKNASTRLFRDEVQVNLGDFTTLQSSAKPVAAVAAPAGAYAPRTAPGPAGRRSLGELAGNESSVDLVVKVQTVLSKEIQTKDGPKTVWHGFLGDATRSLPFTAWKDFGLEADRVYEIRNAYVRTFRENPDVNLGDRATVEPSTAKVDAVEPGVVRRGPAAPGQTLAVKDLAEGMPNVTVTGRILDAEERQINTQNGPKTIVKGTFADATGRIPFTSWSPNERLAAGAAVTIRSAYVRNWRGPELNLGDSAVVEPATGVPPVEAVGAARRATIGELDRQGGGSGVEVEGVILEVKPGSGLIDRCPTCNRVAQKRECRVHGRVEPLVDLRVKAVLDDGFGALTLIVGKEGTERLLGKTFAEAQAMARDALSKEVVEDEVKRVLLGRRLLARGNVTKDEFGLQLIAQEAEVAPPRDAKREAEALLEEVRDLGVMI